MDSTVTLIVTRGPLAGQKFTFEEPAICFIGRSSDCTIALPKEIDSLDVSRQHCLLEISPPSLRIRDLGSLNGTYVNGKKIGQRMSRGMSGDVQARLQPAVALIDGDEIRLGENTVLRVCVFTAGQVETGRTQQRSSGELPFAEPVHS